MRVGYSFRRIWNAHTMPCVTAQWLVTQRRRLARRQKSKRGDKDSTSKEVRNV